MPHPRILAGLLRASTGVDDRLPVDVDAVVDALPVKFQEAPLDGFLGLFVKRPNGATGILIKSGQTAGQRRFTIAHELGHFSLPGHADWTGSACLVSDLQKAAVSQVIEREANEFAAELLMPGADFGVRVDDRDPSFTLVERLAAPDEFWVSRTAAAIRLVELTRERCILVCTEGGRVAWLKRSKNLGAYVDRQPGASVPAGSVAAAVIRGEVANPEPEPLDPAEWFGSDVGPILESTLSIPTLNQVLSLIWLPDD